jgi:hypothetical protein
MARLWQSGYTRANDTKILFARPCHKVIKHLASWASPVSTEATEQSFNLLYLGFSAFLPVR